MIEKEVKHYILQGTSLSLESKQLKSHRKFLKLIIILSLLPIQAYRSNKDCWEKLSDKLNCLEWTLFSVLSCLQVVQCTLHYSFWDQLWWYGDLWITFAFVSHLNKFHSFTKLMLFSLWSVIGSLSGMCSPETTTLKESFHHCQVTAIVNASDMYTTLEIAYSPFLKPSWSWCSLLTFLGEVALFEKWHLEVSWIIPSGFWWNCPMLGAEAGHCVCRATLEDVQHIPGFNMLPAERKCRGMDGDKIGRTVKWSSICIQWNSLLTSPMGGEHEFSAGGATSELGSFFFPWFPIIEVKTSLWFKAQVQSCFMLCGWDAHLNSAQWRGQESAMLLKLIGPWCFRSPG